MKRELIGLPAATGLARGRVRLAGGDTPVEGEGDIVVVRDIVPGAVPGLSTAAGLIVDSGRSHTQATIVARELGIPAVQLRDPLSRVVPGDVVELDGHAGVVRVLEHAKARVA